MLEGYVGALRRSQLKTWGIMLAFAASGFWLLGCNMPLMKAQSGTRVRQSAIVMDLADLEREAGGIVANARAEATRLITDAKAAAERVGTSIREEAWQAGHREGVAAGIEEGRKFGHDETVQQTAEKLAALTERWSKTLDVLQAHMPAHVADAKTDLVRLAVAIAQRVAHQEGIRDRKVTRGTVEETLRLIGSARKVVVCVHPEEMAALQKYLPELLAKIRTIETAEMVADDTVPPGGCVAQFGAGRVDARLETQIRRIAQELLAGEENEPQNA